jgi:hypothetical protein
VWGTRQWTLPHNHHYRAIIGMYGGAEDNIYWRRLPEDAKGRVEAAGAASLRHGEVAVAAAQRLLQYRLRLIRRFADVNVAPQHDRAGLSAVNGAALPIEIGLRAGLLAGEAGARNPAVRQPRSAINRRQCARADMDFDPLCRTQREARSGDPKSPGGTHCFA